MRITISAWETKREMSPEAKNDNPPKRETTPNTIAKMSPTRSTMLAPARATTFIPTSNSDSGSSLYLLRKA